MCCFAMVFIKKIIKRVLYLIFSVGRCIRKGFGKLIAVFKSILILNKRAEPHKTKELSYYCRDRGNLPEDGKFLYNAAVDLSVIIPVYNVEKYIEQCIDSVLRQKTSYSYEVIIINDGSTDNTLSLLCIYESDRRVKIITQENSGQSAARNKAINLSRGKYLMFVDGDDLLLPNAIESLMSAAEKTNSDMAEGSIVRFYNEITGEMIRDSKGKNKIESNALNPGFVLTKSGYSVAKIYRRELWNTLRYPEGYIFEDIITKFILRRKANRVAFIEDVVYGYRQSGQSSSHGSDQLKKLDSIWVLPRIFELCNKENAPRDGVFYLLALNHVGILSYITTRSLSDDFRFSCFAEMRKQLLSIQDCRPKRMPLTFKLLDKSIVENKFDAWEYIAGMIQKHQMLKKHREIN